LPINLQLAKLQIANTLLIGRDNFWHARYYSSIHELCYLPPYVMLFTQKLISV
jgi:hypothetical protein